MLTKTYRPQTGRLCEEVEVSDEEEKGERILVVGIYTLATIALCLTALDVYLLAWVWSSCVELGLPKFWVLQAEQTERAQTSGSSWLFWLNEDQHAEEDKESKFSVRFSKKLSSKQTIQFSRITSLNNGNDRIELIAPNGLELNTQTNVFIDHQHKSSSTTNQTSRLLELQSANSRIQFPNGLLVGGGTVWCPPTNSRESECQVQAKRIGLSTGDSLNRLDGMGKSIQTNQIQSHRLHSATQKLQLHSASSIQLTGHSSIQLIGLEGVTLSSRQSKTRLNSNRIEFSGNHELKRDDDTSGRRHYKLCICKREKTDKKFENEDTKFGLVFAIKLELKCEQFNSFCDAGL